MAGLFYKTQYKNKRGVALMEFLLGFFMFALIVALLYGSFGVVHSSILNSIAARTYTFAMIANRSNIRVHIRYDSNDPLNSEILGYFDRGFRFFGNTTYQPGADPEWEVPTIAMDFIRHDSSSNNNPDNVVINPNSSGGILALSLSDREGENRNNRWNEDQTGELQPGQEHPRKTAIVHQKHGYGICLSASC